MHTYASYKVYLTSPIFVIVVAAPTLHLPLQAPATEALVMSGGSSGCRRQDFSTPAALSIDWLYGWLTVCALYRADVESEADWTLLSWTCFL